jgi:1-acyl-sn-glycerol-3-phosphate acyltransferase
MSLPRVIDSALYHSFYWTCFWGFSLGWSYRAGGRKHVPDTGPALIVCNHVSHFDPPLIGLAARRPLTYLARHTLFTNKLFAAAIRAYGAVPIDRGVGKEGIQAVFNALDEQRAVLMFPEGTRTEDGKMQPLKAGVTLVVKRVECPIIPCGIAGAYDAWPKGQKLPRPSPLFLKPTDRTIAVHFGEPVPPGHYKKMAREDILTDLHARIVAALGDAERLRRK